MPTHASSSRAQRRHLNPQSNQACDHLCIPYPCPLPRFLLPSFSLLHRRNDRFVFVYPSALFLCTLSTPLPTTPRSGSMPSAGSQPAGTGTRRRPSRHRSGSAHRRRRPGQRHRSSSRRWRRRTAFAWPGGRSPTKKKRDVSTRLSLTLSLSLSHLPHGVAALQKGAKSRLS